MGRGSAIKGQAAERCVVVGYDGSASARRAVAQSVRAAGPRGQVILVTVEPKIPRTASVPRRSLNRPTRPRTCSRTPAQSPRRRVPAALPTFARLPGKATQADEILEAARAADADLIVVGRSGKNFLARAILGSVAVRVVKLAHCDVLVVA
jgi:nucleotide-binding universal stress UspA family protein